MTNEQGFSRYQIFLIAVLAILQFSVVLDFMVLSPLGAQLMPKLGITPAEFGWVVSGYAFSAGASGLLAAGFADRFDRKKLLMFFYGGFIIGTLLCGLATSYSFLLIARIITGIFGGVISSISFAVITDLFPMQVRGRVMGFVQMAFAVSQVLGLPAGLYLSNIWDWHAPFIMIVAFSIPLWLLIYFKMSPVKEHLHLQKEGSAFSHLRKTVSTPFYLRAFTATTLLATGGFMLMPFGAAFAVHNLGLSLTDLPAIYLVTGICSMIFGPLMGRSADKFGAIWVFSVGTVLSLTLVLVYCNLGLTPLWAAMAINSILFVGITARMISSSALMTSVPSPADRGAFMSINSSVSQISGGIASGIAGLIIHQTDSGFLENYPALGWVVATSMVVCLALMWRIHLSVKAHKLAAAANQPA